jgi:RNA polymerase sigma-70 factor (ECF subfamily)
LQFARRKGLQEADALDVTQEILAAVEAKIQSWDTDSTKGKFRGWPFRVARNIAVDAIVANAKSPYTGGSHLERQLDPVPDRDQEEFIKNYRQQLLHWAADQVRPRVSDASWRAFWLTAMEGQQPASVAEALGMSAGNVYAAKFRVMTKIQEVVARFDHDEFDEIVGSSNPVEQTKDD